MVTSTLPAPAVPARAPHGRNDQQERASFYLTGRQMATHLATVEGLGLRSVHFAPLRRLDELRHDYPLVLADGHGVHDVLLSLSGLVDDLLAKVATGPDETRLRHRAIALETEVRRRASAGLARLSEVWAEACDALLAAAPAADRELLAADLTRLTTARTVDGDLVVCTRDTPRHVVGHLWQLVQRQRIAQLTSRVAQLRRALTDILDAERASSPAGLAGDRLAHSLGPVVGDELDPQALSALLTHNRPRFALTDARRARVQGLLDVLTTQRFVPCGGPGCEPSRLYDFVYTDVGEAVAAYTERFTATTELAKALVMAQMEADGRYREQTHDALFATWSVADLDAETLELFPEYLVRVDAEELNAQTSVLLLEALAARLPIKVLVQVNDLLAATTPATAAPGTGLPAQLLAEAAMSNGRAFVLQCASAALFHARERIVAGSSAPGAALFAVYSGEGQWLGDLPHYLGSAAAIEARVWPSFAYDPTAGQTWAERFTLACNPQQDRDWPVHRVTYADRDGQRVVLDLPFTAADFWAGDARMARHLALGDGSAGTVPFGQHLAANPGVWADELPSLLMTTHAGELHRVLVDRPLVHLAQRTAEQWRRLQELGGVGNSHVAQARAREHADHAEPDAAPPAAAPAVVAEAPPPVPAAPAADPGLPWIETARCSTCHECRTINDRMFQYDANQQAYVADPDAGTFAQLVQAAESCQVAIIHPGRPRNPAEPGLDDLVRRAAAFA